MESCGDSTQVHPLFNDNLSTKRLVDTHGMDRMMYVRKPLHNRTKYVREAYYRMKYVQESYYRMKYVQEAYYRTKSVWEAYYRMKHVREALYHISTHKLRTYTYRGLSTLREPYHRADIHTTNHTRVTIGLHTYIIDLNSKGR